MVDRTEGRWPSLTFVCAVMMVGLIPQADLLICAQQYLDDLAKSQQEEEKEHEE